MSWSDFHERQVVLDAVLSRARVDPDLASRLDEVPGVARLFGSATNVLLALQQRWTNHLVARLDQAIEDGTPPDAAWLQLAAEQQELRALLDAGAALSQPLRHAQRNEQRLIDANGTGRAADQASERREIRADLLATARP